ncbi:hypothetical protein KVV02_008088 [Mortierella alpina]|uniref:Mitochondrial carrier protein n=1 Tax=Mortierella alpina TaxID=64518 RepID=A0A9P8D1D0_MORAP|nr:hypothetical protein KVV02_008088 [Mortierella alpina]
MSVASTSTPTTTARHAKSRQTEAMLNNLMASSAAALCSRLCTHPLDTLKTRIQVSNGPQPLFSTFVRLAREGGLYRGLPIALTLSAPGLSVYLTAYDLSKERIARLLPSYLGTETVANHLASALVAEVTSGLFWTPMEILKSKQQVETLSPAAAASSSRSSSKSISVQARTTSTTAAAAAASASASAAKPISTLDLARKIYYQEGILGFYRGYFITLGVFVPYSMIYFATYEQLKAMAWRQRQQHPRLSDNTSNQQPGEVLPFMTIVGCAAVACGIAAAASNTVDVVKTRWQTSILTTTDATSSSRRIATQLFRQGGLASFTKGMGARILWMIPSVTISMSLFEWFKAHGLV